MKIGLATNEIEKAKECGYDYVELSGKWIADAEVSQWNQMKERMKQAEISCCALNAYCPPRIIIAGSSFCKGSGKEYAQRVAARIADLDVKTVSIGSPFSRMLPPDYEYARAFHEAEQFFSETAEVMGEYGIITCVESLGTCYCNFLNHVEEANKLVESVHHPMLKLVIDLYNLEHMGETKIDFTPYIKNIAHVHLSDDAGTPQQRSFLQENKKEIHQRRLRRLLDLGYQENITIEIDVAVDLEQAKQSRRFIEEIKR